jgi:hypothetical protein
VTAVEGLYEKGQVRLLESLPGVIRDRVVITIIPETLFPFAEQDGSPLDWQLTSEERAIWEQLSDFRAQHPVSFDSLSDKA